MDDDHTTRGADPAYMRQINATNTLRRLYRAGPMTLTQIVDATGLARKTAEAAIEQLTAKNLVVEVARDEAVRPVGRPARTFRFCPEAGYVLGVQVGGHRVSAVLADLHGTTQAKCDVPVNRAAGRSDRLSAIGAAAKECAAQSGVDLGQVWATTVGTPGLVEDGNRVTLCHVLPEWSDFSLADQLSERIPTPITVENDTNLSAVAEHWRGAATDVGNVVWVLTGRRYSAAILIDGSLYRGADGAAGEIGWLPELGWSKASEQTLSFAGAGGTPAGDSAASMLSRAVAGDDDARREMDAFAASMAPGLTALVLALNPRCLVIGGGIAAAGDTLVRLLADHMRPFCLRLPELRMSSLGDESVALGAVRLGLDHVEDRLFSLSR
ncbi:ROK family protein [Phytoactinopolyspora endophytica]|uniref:ROK family protein n=1 Tax=Phytoactinopolyspora endophytica TaxID=1642495 RepID=UPI00101B96C2|nr:ROK family protein [Phytoactinopolyspora endophytica]